MKLKLRNQQKGTMNKGFSLTETLLAILLLSISVLVVASLTQLSQNSGKYSETKNQQEQLGATIFQHLQYDNSCRNAIGSASGLNLQISPTLFASKLNQPFDPANANGGWEFSMNIPGIGSGPAMNGNTIDSGANNLLMARRLQINRLRLADAVTYTEAGITKYVATVYLQVSEINGMPMRPQMLGSILIETNGANDITTCSATNSEALQNVCTDMGCVYNAAQSPPCRCIRTTRICTAPGYYPVAFKSGVADCRPLGGEDCANPGSYLTGVGIEKSICSDAPSAATTTTTTTSSTTTTTLPGYIWRQALGSPTQPPVNYAGYAGPATPLGSIVVGAACPNPREPVLFNTNTCGWPCFPSYDYYICSAFVPISGVGASITTDPFKCSVGPFPNGPALVSDSAGYDFGSCTSGVATCTGLNQATCLPKIPVGGLINTMICSGGPQPLSACVSGAADCASITQYICIAPSADGTTRVVGTGCSGTAWEPVPSVPELDSYCTSGVSYCSAINQKMCRAKVAAGQKIQIPSGNPAYNTCAFSMGPFPLPAPYAIGGCNSGNATCTAMNELTCQ